MIELCDTVAKVKGKQNLHKNESRYYQMRDIYPFVLEDYKNGKITKAKYNEFLSEYEGLEEQYGWQY